MPQDARQQMVCMEVWGGSQLTTRAVEMGGLDAWVYSKPFGQAAESGGEGGGDVYYASSCATGRINRLLLADVSGHGNSVANVAVGLRGLMRRYVNFLDQTEFVRSMNKKFVDMGGEGCFATAVVTTFFAPTNRLSICNAGHPAPLWYQASTKQWAVLQQSGMEDRPAGQNIPLGILDLVDYEQFDVEMETGDLLVCYTDALSEAKDARGELLGDAGLLRIVRAMGEVPAENFIDRFLAAVAAEHPENLSNDDVTVLVLRPNGRQPHVPLGQQLRSSMRFLGALIRSINPRAERAPRPDFRLANIGGAIFPPLGRKWKPPRKNAAAEDAARNS